MRGKYIVIEGAEGVGKTTQVNKLAEAMRSVELPVKIFREQTLETAIKVQPKPHTLAEQTHTENRRTEILHSNATRSQLIDKIRAARDEGFVCLVDGNYLTELALQFYGLTISTDYERLNQIINFAVDDVKPDIAIVLDAPEEVLITRKTMDARTLESGLIDSTIIGRIRAGYLWEARQRGFPVVYALGTVEEVFREIWKLVAPILAERKTGESPSKPISVAEIIQNLHMPQNTANDELLDIDSVDEQVAPTTFYVPPQLEADIQSKYIKGMTKIINARELIVHQLAQYLLGQGTATTLSVATSMAEKYLKPTLPIAMSGAQDQPSLDNSVLTLIESVIPRHYVEQAEPIRLTHCTPRNELDLVCDVLYSHTDLPASETEALLSVMSYENKASLLEYSLASTSAEHTLRAATYQWDITSDRISYDDFIRMTGNMSALLQSPSPRLGFETPEIIEQANLGDTYAEIFDQSLALYSAMQATGQMVAAEQAVLLGHQTRWKVTTNAHELRFLNSFAEDSNISTGCSELIANLLEKQTEVHPIIAHSSKAKMGYSSSKQSSTQKLN